MKLHLTKTQSPTLNSIQREEPKVHTSDLSVESENVDDEKWSSDDDIINSFTSLNLETNYDKNTATSNNVNTTNTINAFNRSSDLEILSKEELIKRLLVAEKRFFSSFITTH
jgi:hypothetical protein